MVVEFHRTCAAQKKVLSHKIGKLYEVRFIMENIYRVHKINPVGVGKGEFPPLKNYLWKITYRLNLSRIFWGKLFPLFP